MLVADLAMAQIPVTDVSVLAKVIEDVQVATEQLNQLKLQVERLGNPAAFSPAAAGELMRSLANTGVGKTLDELRARANGATSLSYDGNGLYRAPGTVITTADGKNFDRPVIPYRKFDAVNRAKATLEDVMRDTEERRQQLRQQIKTTVSQLQSADTVAAVQKISGLLLAQNSELAAIDREREAALSRLLAQKIENETDAARQEQARREERAVDFRSATDKLGSFLIPNTAPVRIPDPRTSQP